MKVVFNRILIVLYSIYCYVINKIRRSEDNPYDIVVLFPQQLGDSLVSINTINRLCDIFPKEKGYRVLFLARPTIIRFIYDVMNVHKDLICVEVDFDRLLKEFFYYKKLLKVFFSNTYIYTVTDTSNTSEIVGMAVKSLNRIGILAGVRQKKIRRVMQYLAYDKNVIPMYNEMIFIRHKKLLYMLGDVDYKVVRPAIKLQSQYYKGRYCVVAVGASSFEKCWEIEKYSVIVDYIINKYDLDVYLCGGLEDSVLSEKLCSLVERKDKVYNFVGKTDFKHWTSMIQYGEIFIGNDSASTHIAVSSNVKTICCFGSYDKYQFFPYDVENEKISNARILYHEVHCEFCRAISGHYGYGNNACGKRLKEGLCVSCINMIDVREVQKAVDDCMNNEEISKL